MGDESNDGRTEILMNEIPARVLGLLSVAKARFAEHGDARQHYVEINGRGIRISPEFRDLIGQGTLYGAAEVYHSLSEKFSPIGRTPEVDEGPVRARWDRYKEAARGSTRFSDADLSQA